MRGPNPSASSVPDCACVAQIGQGMIQVTVPEDVTKLLACPCMCGEEEKFKLPRPSEIHWNPSFVNPASLLE